MCLQCGLPRTHEEGRLGWKQTWKWKAGRQAGKLLSLYPVLGIVQSAVHFNPWQKCSFQIHLNFSGKQLFWYHNCIDTCILLCREYVMILFKAIFSKHLHTKINSTHQLVRSVFCSKCTCDVNVDRIGPLLTYDSYTHTRAHEGCRRGWNQTGRVEGCGNVR